MNNYWRQNHSQHDAIQTIPCVCLVQNDSLIQKDHYYIFIGKID